MRRTDMIGHAADRQACAAKARRPAVCRLCRQSVSGVPHPIFPRGEGLRFTPFLEIGLGPVRQENPPRFLEGGACLVEGRGRALGVLSRVATRVKAASPAPRILFWRNADSLGDSAGADVAVKDVPAFVLGFEVSAAGELGHVLLKRRLSRKATARYVGFRARGRRCSSMSVR
jgi:hypothetical protein